VSAAASAATYWGQFPTQWGTSITTTTETARRSEEAEADPEKAQDIVFIVAPEEPTVSLHRSDFPYRVSSLSKLLPRMFLWKAPSGVLTVKSTARGVTLSPGVDPSAWRGVFHVHPARNVLFSQTLELRTETLRRLTPRIHIDRRASEQDA